MRLFKRKSSAASRVMQVASPVHVPYLTMALVGTAGVLASALLNRYLARRAERDNPPAGQFVKIDGLDVHYVERGNGRPLVLLHGNGSMIEDFESSGLIDAAAVNHRVIAFDRPGFGHTKRPGGKRWDPAEQADLLKKALDRLAVSDAIILGHSWGTSVAVAMGVQHPTTVGALVLVSGYYYPTFRPDFFAISTPALPFFGNLISQTLAPMMSRVMWPALLLKIFGPATVPKKFRGFPKDMAVRPSQIHASASESALLIPAVAAMRNRYVELLMPVAIVAGAQDRLIDPATQSERLHREIAHSRLVIVPEHGHMVHQTATHVVAEAVTRLA